ncbi:Ubiquitin carboxyl-terminal hydrolase 14 [Chytridiales sp. JEL 0842]|nr:Ubiquitin carboxyl-terminal hydrolase 14 [Chytridiales sp. JEL 0842]
MKVSVKWSGKKFDDIELDVTQPGLVFKTQLYTLTGVEPDRQKIMIKGGTLKDDTDLSALGLKEGHQFLMMGTAGALPQAPKEAVKFVEDMTETQIAQALKVPPGLVNLGNTCYMNATLQCLRAIPQLQHAMKALPSNFSSTDPRSNLSTSLSKLFSELESSGTSVTPLIFLQFLRTAFPQFNEQNNHGFMQQDAEECWGEVISALADKVPGLDSSNKVVEGKKFVDQFMTGEMISTMKCNDAPDESPAVSMSTFRQMKVNIGAGVSTYMISDMQAGLTETLEKNSETLGRSAVYTKKSELTRLPYYLTVNLVRFQWKPSERIKAKILKKVKFPFELDLSPLCTLDLQEKLRPAKLRLKEVDEKKANEKKLKKQKLDDDAKMDVDTQAKDHVTICKEIGVDESLIGDVGCNVSGQYELVAVLTHVGRAADSGHYIGWAKNEKGEWWKFDDDNVSLVSEEEITKLEGGGDWHTEALKLVLQSVAPGVKVSHLCKLGDDYIMQQTSTVFNKQKSIEKGIAFPTCVSVNEIVNNYSPIINSAEDLTLKEGDMVKVELGVHIDGYIATLAHTVILNPNPSVPVTGKHADVVAAAYFAAEAAVRLVKYGGNSLDVVNAVNTVAQTFGVKPVQGTSSFLMKRYILESPNQEIPNGHESSDLEELIFGLNEVYSINILMSTGPGTSREATSITPTLLQRDVEKVYPFKLKASRAAFNDIVSHFSVLPFSIRALTDLDPKHKMGLQEGLNHQVYFGRPVLTESKGELVAQVKVTVMITPTGTLRLTPGLMPPYIQSAYSLDGTPIAALMKTDVRVAKAKVPGVSSGSAMDMS